MENDSQPTPTSLVSRSVSIEGDIQGAENAQIEGHIKGSIRLDGDIIIGSAAVVEADVEGNNIIIKGTVIGNVTAREHLEIQSTGKMNGDITARSIDFKDGSSFEGRSQMIKNRRNSAETVGGAGNPGEFDE
jgi:cytoskeletal protein CcmA (bactofilin family)